MARTFRLARWCMRAALHMRGACRVLTAQERHYRNVNKDKVVQCPHPDCDFWYAVEDADVATADVAAGDQDGGAEAAEGKAGARLLLLFPSLAPCLHAMFALVSRPS